MSNIVLGHIDQLDGRDIVGWLHSAEQTVVPLLLVDGRPATLLNWPTPRPDVSTAMGTPAHTGFRFTVSALPDSAQVSLYAVSTSSILHVQTRSLPQTLCETNTLLQLQQAKHIASQKDAVAITCWEGSHNPIGRAKVLYDILASKRPAIIFTYLMDEFGGALWRPVAQANIVVVSIPWSARKQYHQLISRMGITFDTVWICKPRVPSFQLASVLGHSSTQYILDVDDNESAFAKNETRKDTAYGVLSESLSRYSMAAVPARTVASISLQRDFGGELVRHARQPLAVSRVASGSAYKRIAFVGTVRAHKGILSAAQAIRKFNANSAYRVSLHVYGDIPQALMQQLKDLDVQTQGHVAPHELFSILSTMDAVLTGFPIDDPDVQYINEYQISSKISDALAAGIPVLVPESLSVADLAKTPGIYIFTNATFVSQCEKALSQSESVTLPFEFTLEGAYRAFQRAEKQAQPTMLPFDFPDKKTDPAPPALVLLWKQHDAGLYGRRVDQIARSYRKYYPDHRVVVLELMSSDRHTVYNAQRKNCLSDAEMLLEASACKTLDLYTSSEGIHHCMLFYESESDLHEEFLRFSLRMNLSCETTTFVVFPIVEPFAALKDLLAPFPLLVDFVDNQLFWATTESRALAVMAQYAAWARISAHCLFNNDENMTTFRLNGIVPDAVPATLVPNWYTLPPEWHAKAPKSLGDGLNIVYSGNMNDRIDWSLLEQIADIPGVTVHLIGVAQRVQDTMLNIIQHQSIVYHGAKTELQTLDMLNTMDVAIIPHLQNNCSKFMNPIKVGMYLAAGIPVLSLRVSGIAEQPGIRLCDRAEMLSCLHNWKRCENRKLSRILPASSESFEKLYMSIITAVRTVQHQ